MKNYIRCFFFFIALLLLAGCSTNDKKYENWQTIVLEDLGTIKFPDDWSISKKDNYIYVYDATQDPVMVQSFSYCGISEDHPVGKQETNELYTIQNIRYLTSEVFSNGAVIGTVDCTIDNEECEKLYLSMELGETEYLFIVVNDNINYDQLKEIAKTFELD